MKIVFATNNLNKPAEIRQLMPEEIEILAERHQLLEELPETSDTLEDNAAQKSFYVFDNYGHNCRGDTGLEIDALDEGSSLFFSLCRPEQAEDNIQKMGRDERR